MARRDNSGSITSIQIRKATWRRLCARKRIPGDSFDDVVTRLLDESREGEVKPV